MDVQDFLIIAGAVVITAGLALLSLPAGLIGGGTSLVTLAFLLKDD